MDLEMPTESVCPLCRRETTVLQENKAGRPYFQCHTFDSVVNLRPGSNEDASEILNELAAADAEEQPESVLNESEEGETDDSETKTLGDLLKND